MLVLFQRPKLEEMMNLSTQLLPPTWKRSVNKKTSVCLSCYIFTTRRLEDSSKKDHFGESDRYFWGLIFPHNVKIPNHFPLNNRETSHDRLKWKCVHPSKCGSPDPELLRKQHYVFSSVTSVPRIPSIKGYWISEYMNECSGLSPGSNFENLLTLL